MTQAGAPTLYPSEVETRRTPQGMHIYWRKADGWIVHSSSSPTDWARSLRRGMTPLVQYGQFPPGNRAVDDRGVAWSPHMEPWRLIFQRGGAHEFPLEQIVAYHWHLAPPYREAVFPQLEGVEIPVYDCPECDRGIFSEVPDLAAHLRLGHGWQRAELAEYGREVGIKFSVRRSSKPREEKRASPVVEELTVASIQKEGSYRCKVCGWAPTKGAKRPQLALAGHMRVKHKAASRKASAQREESGNELSELSEEKPE